MPGCLCSAQPRVDTSWGFNFKIAPQFDALEELKQRVSHGECSALDLEGVGATTVVVPAHQCADVYPRCAAFIAAGMGAIV